MTDSRDLHHAQRSLLLSLLAALTLFVLLVLFATKPLAAAPEQAYCYATPDGGGVVYDSMDSADALRSAIADVPDGGTVWVAGTCQGAVEEEATTQVARITKSLTIIGYDYDPEATENAWMYDENTYATIDGQIDEENAGRVFYVQTAGPVTLRNLHMVNGATSGNGGAIYSTAVMTIENSILESNESGDMGGAIASYDDVTIRNTQLISNTARYHGGAIAGRGSGNAVLALESVEFTRNSCTNAVGCFGGALSALHTVTMTDTWFADNQTTGSGFASGGGAVYTVGDLAIENSHFVDNSTGATGGALYTHASLSIVNAEFTGNRATLDAGAIATNGTGEIVGSHLESNIATGGSGHSSPRGGAILNNGALTLSASNIYSNTAFTGGGIYNTANSELNVFDGSDVSWNRASTGFGSGGGVRNDGVLSIADSHFGNNLSASGGAVATNNGMELRQTVLENNDAGSGGAINHSRGVSTIENATFSGNRATAEPDQFSQPGGGAISMSIGDMTVNASTFDDNDANNRGGAIYLSTSFAANLTVSESVIRGNTADYGGGLYVREDTTITASRIFDNQAINGGALVVTGEANVALTNNFIAGNEGFVSGDTIYFDEVGDNAGTLDATHNTFVGTGEGTALETNGELAGYTVMLTNAIFSGYETAIVTASVSDTVTVDGVLWHDVTTETSGTGITVNAANEYTGDPAFLDAAANDYHLLPASAAIDRGVTTAVDTDIDGEARPAGTGPDLGADEVAVLMPDLVIRKTVEPVNPAPGAQVTYQITFSNAGIDFVEDVVVSDVLPSTLEVLSVTSEDFELPPGTGTTWEIGTLEEREGGTITVVVQVLSDVPVGTEIVNDAAISGSTEEFTDVNNTASVTITVDYHRLYLPLIMR
ncbi:MAG: choice-of-anchor Q domain-containing protein [Anaerolineae bacterium]|nr:choice-of-anchor Q domain-containing protein [Anaerolineae bacterium]